MIPGYTQTLPMEQEIRTAQTTFELENSVSNLEQGSELFDKIYSYDPDEQEERREQAPWKQEYVCLGTICFL